MKLPIRASTSKLSASACADTRSMLNRAEKPRIQVWAEFSTSSLYIGTQYSGWHPQEAIVEPLSINQTLSALSKMLENAQELIEEAELLLSNNKNARAFALAHLASEELVKFNLLLPVTLELARDHSIDWKEIGIRLRSHHVKIRGAILLDFLRTPPQDGIYQSRELSQQMSTSEKLNNMKNYSIYTSQIDQEFVKPSELIDNETAMACVSHARELLEIYQMAYSGLFMLTQWTEEGLRHCIEMPVFQDLFKMLGSITDLSNLPLANKQQSMAEITAFFNDPTFQLFLAQIPSTMEQELQSLNQTQNQTHQDRQEPQ